MSAFSGNLRIDLAALAENYRLLDRLSAEGCETAAAVKADAYGLGAAPAAQALYEAGCRTFFVATPQEGVRLSGDLPGPATIAILHGYAPEDEKHFARSRLTPVLNSLEQIRAYAGVSKPSHPKPAILHFDTGMNRLGLGAAEVGSLSKNKTLLEGLKIEMIMSHFISAEERQNPHNEEQAKRFTKIAQDYPGVRRSLCNSSAIFGDKGWHGDLTRPGMALYGLNPTPEKKNPMRRVVSLDAPVLQIKTARLGETAGYNATYRFDKETRLAIVGVGYADGLLRTLGNKAVLYWRGHALPIRGRVSMDLIICDLSSVPESQIPGPGDRLEVLGENQDADALAKAAGTIGYEILTSLGQRYKRIYVP